MSLCTDCVRLIYLLNKLLFATEHRKQKDRHSTQYDTVNCHSSTITNRTKRKGEKIKHRPTHHY